MTNALSSSQKEELVRCSSSVLFNADMGSYSTLKTGGVAAALVEVKSRDELKDVVSMLETNSIQWQILGGGSNILVGCKKYNGVFIRLSGDFKSYKFADDPVMRPRKNIVVGAGCSLARIVSACIKHGVAGLEWAVGIPGSVGGAIWMNGGAFQKAMADIVSSVTVVGREGDIKKIPAGEIQFAYRKTIFPQGFCQPPVAIIEATLVLLEGNRQRIKKETQAFHEKRKQAQPQGVASAGSFFKNPPGDFAGRLIEAAGMKGMTFGGAQVSPEHANFIINTGTATPEDIIGLMKKIQETVYRHSGVLLEPEVHLFN